MTTKEEMIELHLKGRDITDPRVIKAMEEINRENFMPDEVKEFAYEDTALPIWMGQTISQPYIVSYMAQILKLKSNDKVLEVGTGSGYNAAVLSKIASHIYSIEIIKELAVEANENLKNAGIKNISIRHGNGYMGWHENAPFDVIVLTAAPPEIPQPLKQQLKTGGKLLAPVGKNVQHLILLEKTGESKFIEKKLLPVQFIRMTGGDQINIRK
jgi:protein-L-isoaspartate(D-aspartate) O-methyltransferase